MSSLPAAADHGDDEAPSNVIDIFDDAEASWNDLSDDEKLLQYTEDLSYLEEELKIATDPGRVAHLELCIRQCLDHIELYVPGVNGNIATPGVNSNIATDDTATTEPRALTPELADAQTKLARMTEKYNNTKTFIINTA